MASSSYEHNLQIHFAGHNPKFRIVHGPPDIPIDSTRIQKGVSLFFDPKDSDLFHLIEMYYPAGHFETILPPGGSDPLYLFAEMTKAQLESRQGLEAEYTRTDGGVVTDVIESTHTVWQMHGEIMGDLRNFSWHGTVQFSESGEYLFEIIDDKSANVYLDGQLILSKDTRRAIINPVIGLHNIEVVGTNPDMNGSTTLLWKPPGRELEPIPFGRLFRRTLKP